MAKLKKQSSDLINIIDIFPLDQLYSPDFNDLYHHRQFSSFFDSIIEKYKSINIDKASIKHSKTQLYPTSGGGNGNGGNGNGGNGNGGNGNGHDCSLIELFRFLYKNNDLDGFLSSYTSQQIDQFKKTIEHNRFDMCSKWINLYGKAFMNNIFILIQNESIHHNKLPEALLKKINFIDKDIYSEFTSLDVLKDIEHLMNYKHHFSITYNDIVVELSIFDYKNTINKKKLMLIFKRILLMALIKQNKKTGKIKLNVSLILTNKTKTINQEYKTLGPKEINSGLSTYAYNYDEFCKVVIYREEELNKLLVHELIHNLRLDFLVINFPDFYKYVNIHPDTTITFNESYTEVMACILNSIICSYEFNNRKNKHLATKYLYYEIVYSLYQTAKILVHFGFKQSAEFFTPNNPDNLNHTLFTQNTNVFSYFIVKTSLLFNLETLLMFVEDTNYMETPLSNGKYKANYLLMVKKSLLNPKFITIINGYMNYILSVKQKKKIYNTLRMTIIEI